VHADRNVRYEDWEIPQWGALAFVGSMPNDQYWSLSLNSIRCDNNTCTLTLKGRERTRVFPRRHSSRTDLE
jgi:hypothetical protein